MERDSELSNQPSPPTPLPRLGEGSKEESEGGYKKGGLGGME